MHREDRAEKVGNHGERGEARPQAENERGRAGQLPGDRDIGERRRQAERAEELRCAGRGEDEELEPCVGEEQDAESEANDERD